MEKNNKQMNFYNILRNLFFIILILQFTPALISNLRTSFEETVNPSAHVAYLTINGPIFDSSFYVKKIEDFSENKDIKALLLKINSPGGYPGSCQAIFNELLKFKKKKPIVSFVENTCASGGYYVASASNKIFANSLSMIGSVGALMELPNVKGLLNNWMVNYTYVQAGEYKTAGSPVKDLTPKELAYLQNLANDNYKEFVKDIKAQRNVGADDKKWADGKVFTGSQALKLNMIDEIGSYSDAIAEIKKLINIEPDDKIKLVKPKKPTGLMKLFGAEEEYGEQGGLADKTAAFIHNVYQKFMVRCSVTSSDIQAH
ncbi:MAG: signal peptide peptidase SppA [Epsilonproteobacteria bacterium]|nr:signal peptide peptidase SppA [Campylobacterota bacterium]